ncbi:MAG: hypothetical protein ACYDAY_05635 [Candidatus Dormibacteria bacterium]
MVEQDKTERKWRQMELQARLFDMGHRADETMAQRLLRELDEDHPPSEHELRQAMATEHAREAMRRSFG